MPEMKVGRSLNLVVVLSLWCALTGCAHVNVDPDGTRHIAGFVLLTLPPQQRDIGADAVRLRSLGLTLTGGHAAGTQLTLGYADTTIATLRNDSLVPRAVLRRVLQANPTPQED